LLALPLRVRSCYVGVLGLVIVKAHFAKVLWPQVKALWDKVMVEETHYYDEDGVLRKYKKGQIKWSKIKYEKLFDE